MKKSTIIEPSRRQFITRILPACSVMCLGAGKLFALKPSDSKSIIQEKKHMFDTEYPRKLTNRQYFTSTYRDFINLAKAFEKEFGKEKTIELIKEMATESGLRRGQRQAKKSKDTSLKTYTRMFANPKSPMWAGNLKYEVVEDIETAFELKVEDCISASIFRDANAANIGYAWVCWADYAWAQGFNPKIKLVRNKTLMQGHDCCNHRYVLTE